MVWRKRVMRVALGVALLVGMTALALWIYARWNAPPALVAMAGVSEPESEIAKLVNGERARDGLRPLGFSSRLAVVARGHSYDMAIRHYRSSRSPEGSTPADRARGVDLDYRAVAENIYVDSYGDFAALARRALGEWLSNPEHRANLLSSQFTATGVGIARSSDGSIYITEDFVR